MRKSTREPREPYPPFVEYLRKLQMERGFNGVPATYEALGELFGVPSSSITGWMKGFVPSKEKARLVADHAKIPRTEFMYQCGYIPPIDDWEFDRLTYSGELFDESDLAKTLRKFGRIIRADLPLLGGVPCGPADERSQEFLGFLSERFPGHYLLEVQGDSMPPFKPKDIIVVKPSETPVFDKPNICLIDGESTCKTVEDVKRGKHGGQVYVLSSKNGEHKTFEVEVERIQFQGVVVKHMADV